jgi:segregation and condensation protein B
VSRKRKSRGPAPPPADATLPPSAPEMLLPGLDEPRAPSLLEPEDIAPAGGPGPAHASDTITPPPLEAGDDSAPAQREERDTLSSPPRRVPNPDAGARIDADDDALVEAARDLTRDHLRGLLEALIFATDKPITSSELARLASAPTKQVKLILAELKQSYAPRGFVLDEVAGGWLFRTNVQFAPFVRELTSERPVRLTRAQVETLAIVAYRQPITRPEVDEIRGVDSGATLKLLLERDLVRILGKKDEPGRPMLYGTSGQFLEFFGLKSLKDLPTLREFTELSDESRRVAEATLGDVLPSAADPALPPSAPPPTGSGGHSPTPSIWPDAPTEEEHDTMIPSAPPTGDLDEDVETGAPSVD